MIRAMLERLRQKHRTIDFPRRDPVLPARFKGRPIIAIERCGAAQGAGCQACATACATACPTAAVGVDAAGPVLDLGRCLFCGACAEACPAGVITFSGDFRLATRRREDLIWRGGQEVPALEPLEPARLKLFKRSLKLRQVSAGGCNACEADLNVLSTVVFDLGRFGIDFVASPRHADGVVVTGPVTANMREALELTLSATPDPKIVVAVGACAVSGGVYAGFPESHDGVGDIAPVDLYVPGCPPHPLTILDGLLRLLGRGGGH